MIYYKHGYIYEDYKYEYVKLYMYIHTHMYNLVDANMQSRKQIKINQLIELKNSILA